MDEKAVLIIDETIREGMQFQGVMFSTEQRRRILDFQEKLKVDICQAGYPPAHESEALAVEALVSHCKAEQHRIGIAAMGRATVSDAEKLLKTGAQHLHFHIHIKEKTLGPRLESILDDLFELINFVKQKNEEARISIAMLDIGKCSHELLEQCCSAFYKKDLDILSLPDTSGILPPNRVFETIQKLAMPGAYTRIAIHCHDDMGMASANALMGIAAGARVLEASALGIGERNGISDLYTAGKMLKEMGYKIRMNTDDPETFEAYYRYVDTIVYEQTGIRLLNARTPAFGRTLATHVAGTHAGGDFGSAVQENFCINVLCGNRLLLKFLTHHGLTFPQDQIPKLTALVKERSAHLNRAVSAEDLKELILSFHS